MAYTNSLGDNCAVKS